MAVADQLKEMQARGAIEVKDGSGCGFADDALEQELDADLARELAEIEDRIANGRKTVIHNQAAEEAARYREETDAELQRYRFEDQDILTDFVPGRMLGHSLFLEKLRRLNRTLFYNSEVALGRLGLNYLQGSKKAYATSVQFGIMPEFSQLRVNERGLPSNERYRGWRTVLLALIRKGVVTESQVAREFGEPNGTPARNSKWKKDLWRLRNGL